MVLATPNRMAAEAIRDHQTIEEVARRLYPHDDWSSLRDPITLEYWRHKAREAIVIVCETLGVTR